VKQKTAVPQGAASLSLAVLESDGRKREVATGNAVGLRRASAETKSHALSDVGSVHNWRLANGANYS
jgi:hypothetical protein